MANLIKMEYHGIKCDNPNCGWADWSVTQDMYDDYVDRPCPVCGENLLTKECHERTKKILECGKKLNDLLNQILPEDIKQYAEAHVDEYIVRHNINADGTIGEKLENNHPNIDLKI